MNTDTSAQPLTRDHLLDLIDAHRDATVVAVQAIARCTSLDDPEVRAAEQQQHDTYAAILDATAQLR